MGLYLIGIPLLMVAAALDASVMYQLRVLNGQPSLVLMIIVSWGLLNPPSEAMPWAFIGGVCADLLSIVPLGASSLAFGLVLLLNYNLFGRIGKNNLIFPLAAIILGTLIYQTLLIFILIVFGWSIPVLSALLRWLLPSMIYNLIFVLIIFRSMASIVEFLRPPQSAL